MRRGRLPRMRHRTPRAVTAAAALLAIAAATGCARDGPGPAGAVVDAVATSSSRVPAPLIAAATWADSEFGATLEVAPTPAGRAAGDALAAAEAWREVLQLAPAADSPGMWEQFDCHWTWARLLEPDKPSWNIEPWRPVVDPDRMLAEGCNPGGPEV